MTKAAKSESIPNVDIKGYLDRAINIENEIATLTEDRKELGKEMKGNGINAKAFAIALKEMRKPLDASLRIKANEYLSVGGQLQLFAL